MRVNLSESTPLASAATPAEGPGRLMIRLMTPGWGSSGYYSTDVVEAAARDRVFPAGTHMYINHPSESEAWDRPERDLSTLAGVLAEDATWTGEGLDAPVVVFSNWRVPISEMAEHIGVSIRGSAEIEEGEAEGRKGRIVARITEGASVDFVTKAGRGGKVLSVLESAREVRETTANDTRDALSQLLRVEHAGDDRWVWLRDYDPDTRTVWFELETGEAAGQYGQRYSVDPSGVPQALDGSRFEVRVNTEYVPVDPAGQITTTTESKEDTMPQIEEARLRQLEEAEGRVQSAETERDAALARAEESERQRTEALATANRATVAGIVATVFAEAEVSAPASARALTEALTTAAGTEPVDEETVRERASEAAAEIAALSGTGSVRGLGESAGSGDSDDLSDEELAESLGKIRAGTYTVKEA